MFGDVNVKVEDGNLGRSSSTGTGTSIKIGISNVESKSPILISGTMNAKKIKEKVGNTPLADACIDAVEWGASSIYCIPVKAGTAGTIGKITEDQKGYGTFEVKGSPNNAYDIVVEVMDAGECNEGSFRYSLDGGNTFTEEMTIPITGEAELATTGLTAKFTDAEGGDSFMEGDRFTFSTSKKVISESKRIASLELWAPDIAGIKVKKKTTKKKTTKKSTKRSKSKKSKSKSPAKDSRNTSRGKKAARAAVK